MSKKLVLKVAAGAVALLSLSALAVACGGGGSNNSASNQNQQPAQQQAAASIPAKLYLSADTVRGTAGLGDDVKAARGCVQESKFPLGSQIVWRIRVMDPKTGQPMDDKSLASVQVLLGDGQVLDAKYGGHPGSAPIDFFWAVSFKVPTNYPTGNLDYKVVAKDKEGRTGEWNQFKVASAMLQIVKDEPLALNDSLDTGAILAAAR